MQQSIEIWLEDKPGALMRVAGIVTAKGYNISSLAVSPDAKRAGISRMLLVADIESRLQIRILKEIERLVNVLHVVDLSNDATENLAC